MHLLMQYDAPTCGACEDVVVSVRHILCECRVYREERQRIDLSGDLSVVLGNGREHLDKLFAFLAATNLFREI